MDTVHVEAFRPLDWLRLALLHRAKFEAFFALYAEWQAAPLPSTSDEGFSARLTIALKGAKLIATWTPTTADDEAVKLVDQLLASDSLRKTLAGYLRAALESGSDESVHATEVHALHAEVQALGIDWSALLRLLPTLIELFRLFRSGGGVPPALAMAA